MNDHDPEHFQSQELTSSREAPMQQVTLQAFWQMSYSEYISE